MLFWKSLPHLRSATVLSKLFVALIAIPLVYFAAADVSDPVDGLRDLRAGASGVRQHPLAARAVAAAASSVAVRDRHRHVWYLPVVGWLLLVSAWAKRAVILQAILPPLAIILAERVFLGTHVAALLFRDRLLGGTYASLHHPIHWSFQKGEISPGVWQLPDPVGFVSSVDDWIGALIGAAFIAGAVQLRKRRTDA